MEVDSVSTSEWVIRQPGRKPDNYVKGVFSEVLAEVGRQGYASAADIPEEVPLAEQISISWSEWFDAERTGGRYRQAAEADELKQTYGQILLRAHEEGGYADPNAFLQTLSEDEMEVVQQVHALADRIQPASLTEEGALNLLIPPPAQVDLDRDGITRCGVGCGVRFPDSNTPDSVADAWEEATAGMPLKERMLFEFQMLVPRLLANIVCTDAGEFVRMREPGDPDYVNPMASSGYSYVQAAQDRLDYLERFRCEMPAEQYEKGVAFWTRFQELLAEHGAN